MLIINILIKERFNIDFLDLRDIDDYLVTLFESFQNEFIYNISIFDISLSENGLLSLPTPKIL